MEFRTLFLLLACMCGIGLYIVASNFQEEPQGGPGEGSAAPPEAVVQLTQDTFDAAIKGGQSVVIVEFYTTWCGFCKKLALDYEKAAQILKEHRLVLYKVECQTESALCTAHNVTGYPTVRTYIDGEYYKDFDDRTVPLITNFMIRMNKPRGQFIHTVDEFQQYAKTNDVSILGVFDPAPPGEKSQDMDLFDEVATEYREAADFARATHPDIRALLGLKAGPGVVAFTSLPSSSGEAVLSQSVFHLEYTRDNLRRFVFVERLPLVGKISGETYGRYLETRLKIVFVFYLSERPEDMEALVVSLAPLATKYRYVFMIGLIDAFEHKSLAANLGLEFDIYPSVAVNDPDKNYKYPLPQSEVLDLDVIDQSLAGIAAGTILPKFNSAPVPEANDQPVKTIVHSTFEDRVLDPEKDVVLIVFAPWCQACKRVAPMFDKIALQYSDSADKLLFGTFDIDKNDFPPGVDLPPFRVIPAIFLFPARAKAAVKLPGDVVDTSSFSAWYEEHSYYKVKPSAVSPEELHFDPNYKEPEEPVAQTSEEHSDL